RLRQHVNDLAALRHPELFAGDALDGEGGALDAVDLRAQAGVLGFAAGDVGVQRRHALARGLQLPDARVAKERDDGHAGEGAEDQHSDLDDARGGHGSSVRELARYNPSVKRDAASHPLTERYASREMSYLFSPDYKFRTWRRLWIALAEAERELGLNITEQQIAEMKATADDVNYADAERLETEIRHHVMEHIYAFGLQAPSAKPIIHLGATSAFVTDNTDILQMREALAIVVQRLINLIAKLRDVAWRWRATPQLAFTHFQAAQLTTVGKRATLWLHDLLLDLAEVEYRRETLALLGVKGATGTQASFLNLFEGDEAKVNRLEQLVAEKL